MFVRKFTLCTERCFLKLWSALMEHTNDVDTLSQKREKDRVKERERKKKIMRAASTRVVSLGSVSATLISCININKTQE